MEAGLPDEDSEQSQEGVLLHDYAAHPEYDRSVLKPHQKDLLDLSDSLVQLVIAQVENRIGRQEVMEYLREFPFGGIVPGTPDLVIQYPGANLVIDQKFGYNVVERAELNLQLRTYAVIVYNAQSPKPNKMFVAIVQPRLPYEQRVTIAEYLPADIEASEKEIQSILENSKRDRARLTAGEEQCRYCKAKLTCPAFHEAMTLPAVVTPDTTLSKRAREEYLEKRLAELNDDQLEKVLVALRLANFIHDPALDEARKRIKAGGMENFKLGAETEARNVINVRRAIALLSLSGISKEQIFDCIETFSLGTLAEILRKMHNTWTFKDANEYINKKLDSVIERTMRKPRVLRK